MSFLHVPSLRWRLVLIMCAAYVAVAVISGAASFRAQQSALRHQLVLRSRNDAAILAAGAALPISEGGKASKSALSTILRSIGETESVRSIVIYGQDGCRLVNVGPVFQKCLHTVVGNPTSSLLPSGDAVGLAPILPPAGALSGYARVQLNGSSVQTSLQHDLAVDGYVALGGLLLFALLSLLISRYILGPVAKLADAAGALRRGQMSTRVSEQGATELATLAGAFNEMAASLERRIEHLSFLAHTAAILPNTLQSRSDVRPLLDEFIRVIDGCAAGLPEYPDLWWDNGVAQRGVAARALGHVTTPTLTQNDTFVLMAVPVAQGVFVAIRDGRIFTRDEQQVIANFAFQLGIAAENVRLFEGQQEALHVKDQFLSIVSHELRTPLTTMKGYAQMLRRRLADDPEGHRFAASIDAQVGRLSRLVDDLLDVTRFSRGQFELTRRRMDLRPMLDDAINRFRIIAPNHTLRLELEGDSFDGWWDRDRVDQVLNNLIGNAVKYSPDGGDIIVRAEQEGDNLRVSVRDHGVGIPEDEQEQLFERFYRTSGTQNVKGLGLGLYVTRRVIEAHGGHVGVWSRPGEGSEFYFTLPVHVANAAAT